MKPVLYAFPDDESFADALARTCDLEHAHLEWRHFPDGESLVTLKGDCADRDVIVLCSLTQPDAKTLPLYFLAATARELGAQRVGLVAPYLAYMRQDERFQHGQSRSAHLYAKLMSGTFDWLLTVDPHLHRVSSLDQIYSIPARAVSAMPAVAEWIRANVETPIIIGPDAESRQWVEPVARATNAPFIVLEKKRHGDRQVEVSAVDPALVRGRTPVVLDDIVSSGQTFIEVLNNLARAKINGATCIAVHALLARDTLAALLHAGARRIVSTNTVPHETNTIDVVPLVAAALNEMLRTATVNSKS